MAMQVTKYDYDIVKEYWMKAKDLSGQIKETVGASLNAWTAANEACEGIDAIPSLVTYLTRAKELCDSLVDLADKGYALNEKYAEDMAEAARDIHI